MAPANDPTKSRFYAIRQCGTLDGKPDGQAVYVFRDRSAAGPDRLGVSAAQVQAQADRKNTG